MNTKRPSSVYIIAAWAFLCLLIYMPSSVSVFLVAFGISPGTGTGPAFKISSAIFLFMTSMLIMLLRRNRFARWATFSFLVLTLFAQLFGLVQFLARGLSATSALMNIFYMTVTATTAWLLARPSFGNFVRVGTAKRPTEPTRSEQSPSPYSSPAAGSESGEA